MTHTKGNLTFEIDAKSKNEDVIFNIKSGEFFVASTIDWCEGERNSEANARRLVACWNACEGSATDGLEAMVASGRSVANMAMLYERAMDRRENFFPP